MAIYSFSINMQYMTVNTFHWFEVLQYKSQGNPTTAIYYFFGGISTAYLDKIRYTYLHENNDTISNRTSVKTMLHFSFN